MFHCWNILFLVPKIPEPECRVDQDCQSKLACIDESCQNPCRINNPCTGEQQCVVKDTLPTRTVACVCPEGTVVSDRGHCQKGNNSDWIFRYSCIWLEIFFPKKLRVKIVFDNLILYFS